MNTRSRKKKGNQTKQMRCPYCGSPVVFRSADGIYRENKEHTMLYVCSRYPECDAYVRVHKGTKTPVGSLADHNLRALRREAHRYFNRLYESGLIPERKSVSGHSGKWKKENGNGAECALRTIAFSIHKDMDWKGGESE